MLGRVLKLGWGEIQKRVRSGFALKELSLVAKNRSVLDEGKRVLETQGKEK